MNKLLKKYQNLSLPVKTTIWFTICNFLQRGTSLLTVPIFTRLLTTEEYGVTNIYFSWFEIFVLIGSLKLPYEGLNNGLIRHEEDKDGYTSSIVGLMAVMTLAEILLYIVFRQQINGITGFNTLIMVMMFVQILFNPPLYLWINRERFDFHYRWPAIVTMISTVAAPAIAIIAVMQSSYKAEARIMATSMVQGAFGLVLAVWLIMKGKKFYDRHYWHFAFTFNAPLIFYYLSQTLLNQSDRIMIGYYTSTGDAAVYSVAYSAAAIMQLFISAINASLNPWMYRKIKAKQYDEVKKITWMIFLLLGAATAALMAFAPDIIFILAGKKYSDAIWVIPPVAASVFFIFVYMLFANIMMYYGNVKSIPMISIVCSMVNVGLNAWLIPRYGYLAAGWTTLISYILMTIMYGKLAMNRKLMDMPRITGVCLLITALAFIMLWVYTLGFIRYILLLVGVILAVCNYKKIIKVVGQLRERE